MLKSLLASALAAGLAAGLVAAALQLALLVPLIGEAELYEDGTLSHFAMSGEAHAGGHGAEAHAHDHGDEGGMMRHILTVVMTAATYTGFALLLVACFALAERFGLARIDARNGLIWGLCGFAATQLLPALGLAPELPGAAAAEVADRQLWWLGTAAATAAGLAIVALAPGWLRLAGVAVIALPHLVGAPHLHEYAGVTPPELAALFAARVLVVGAVAWCVLGWLAGRLWAREQAAG